jgi:proline dehydrogenase
MLDLQNTEVAYADKTDAQLNEKRRLFSMLNSPLLNSLGAGVTRFALSIGLPIEGLIKATVYEQFCGGETIEECEPVVERLFKSGIGSILDYSIEGKTGDEDFDATRDEIIRTIERAKDDPRVPFAVFKVSGIAPLGTLEKMSAKKKLDAKSQAKCERIHKRIASICQAAYDLKQPVFIDAEESWTQDAVDRLAADMMEQFNREQPIVYNTVQLYRTGRLHFMKESRRQAHLDGYVYAVKLVRGAYMEKERERAVEKGYASPIHANKAATDADFDAAVEYCIKHYKDMAFVAGTHNEESVQKLAALMNDHGIASDDPNVAFSQLYGMGDNISFVLGQKGFNVSKYLPYGPVAETLPYLIRRAEENSSAAGHMSRELEMIEREIRRRNMR